jgi:hypothetical protein
MEPNLAQMQGFKRLARMSNMPGSGQVVVACNYAYLSHMRPPIGTSIFDISNPYRPEELGYYIPEPVDGQRVPQSNDVFCLNDHI